MPSRCAVSMVCFLPTLPISAKAAALTDLVSASRRVMLAGPSGLGSSVSSTSGGALGQHLQLRCKTGVNTIAVLVQNFLAQQFGQFRANELLEVGLGAVDGVHSHDLQLFGNRQIVLLGGDEFLLQHSLQNDVAA